MLNFINSDANDVPLPGTDWGPAGGSEAPERREANAGFHCYLVICRHSPTILQLD